MRATEAQLAWAAGFYEGEGSLSFTSSRGVRHVQFSIHQINRQPLERFAEIFGCDGLYIRADRGISQLATSRIDLVWRITILLWPWLSDHRHEQMAAALNAYMRHPAGSRGGKRGTGTMTHCVNGHEFTLANTHFYRGAGTHYRRCRKCRAAYERQRMRRKVVVAA